MSVSQANKKEQIMKVEGLWLDAHLDINIAHLDALMHKDFKLFAQMAISGTKIPLSHLIGRIIAFGYLHIFLI
jgi:hypothetical protein